MYSKINQLKQLAFSLLISVAFTFTACGSMHMHIDDDLKLIKEKTFNISPGKSLIVDLSSGDVKVTYWDKSEVSVKIFGDENAFDKMDFDLNGSDEMVEVIDKKKSSVSSWFSNVNVEVEVKVPTNFNLDINTAGGDIKCGGINGSAQLNTSGGDVWADKFSGKLNVSTSGGDIFLFCNNAIIEAETSGGDIKLEYEGENQGIDLSTSGGDIDIKLPNDFKASIELSTSGGDVSCSLNMNNIKKSYETNLVGDINGGGQKLIAHTSGGDITVTEE
jgi:DUF4097 and DUF4098 domain-containing protein YvlB